MEKLVLSAFIHDAEFNSTLLPHIAPEYFEDSANQIIIESAMQYCNEHKQLPPKIVLETIIESKLNIPESVYQKSKENLDEIYSQESKDDVNNATIKWKLDESLKWLIQRRSYLVIEKSIQIMSGSYKENGVVLDKSAIPDMMQKALAINFDTTIGHDYIEDADSRFEFMHKKVNKIPFKIPILNKITLGGVEKKSLNTFMGGTGTGKSLVMCSLASDYISLGYNVLYITLEMAEEKISTRIDANLLNVELDQLKNIPKSTYLKKFDKFREDGYGKLIVKEYPTASAGVGHFRFLMRELEAKQDFIPDIVFIDYLGIAASSRYKSDNMYQIGKSISEEFRGLAVEKDVAIWTAVQSNRGSQSSSDVEMTDISESFGINMVCDFILAIISTQELKALGQLRFKQLKNRYEDMSNFSSFLLNVATTKMKIFQDDDYTRKNLPEIIERKKPDSILPNKSKFDSMRQLK